MDSVTVVIPSHNEGRNLVDTVRCILKNTSHPDFDIVVVDDGSTDRSGQTLTNRYRDRGRIRVIRSPGVGVAGARNLGARNASGKVLIFLDGHCYTPLGWMEELIQPLADARVGMTGPTLASIRPNNDARGWGLTWRDASLDIQWLPQQGADPYPVPLLTGACQAVRSADFQALGGYDSGMTRWGSEDLELCLRYWLMGYETVIQPRTVVYHLFRDSHPYEVRFQEIIYNRLRMAMLHLSTERLRRVLDCHENISGFPEIVGRLQKSDVMACRQRWLELRCRSDDWYFARFGCQV